MENLFKKHPILPHLQYCLIVWGDFDEGRNKALGENLLRYQKRFAGMIADRKGTFHSDPIFSKQGMLKINDLYKQQLRVHAWKFIKNKLPENQSAMLNKISQVHTHNTRSAGNGLFVSTQDHRAVGFRIPKEWLSLPEELKKSNSLGGFKRKSKEHFISCYESFVCNKRDCYVCTPTDARAGLDDGQ